MAATISLINQKGGVGKSSVTFNLGAVYAAAECRTLIVDADPQGNLSSGIFGPATIEQLPVSASLAGLFSGDVAAIEQVILATPFENLYLLPANELLARYSLPVEMAGSLVATLRDMVHDVAGSFDVILFDNAPALNSISWASLMASQHVLVPTIPEDYSSQGLAQVRRTVAAACVRNPKLAILGLVLTMVQPRLTVHKAYEQVLREQYGELVLSTIIKAEKLHKEAITQRQPLAAYKPKSAAAKVYKALGDEIVDRIEKRQQQEAA